MWIAVLLVLLITGAIFYGLAKYYMYLQDFRKDHDMPQGKVELQEEGLHVLLTCR